MLFSALFACNRAPLLGEVPIDGGTPELRDAVRASIAFWDRAAGPGRVQLRAVHVVPPGGETRGRYNPSTRTIEIAEDASIGSTVRHELCHALVDQGDLRRREPRTMERVAEVLFDRHIRTR